MLAEKSPTLGVQAQFVFRRGGKTTETSRNRATQAYYLSRYWPHR